MFSAFYQPIYITLGSGKRDRLFQKIFLFFSAFLSPYLYRQEKSKKQDRVSKKILDSHFACGLPLFIQPFLWYKLKSSRLLRRKYPRGGNILMMLLFAVLNDEQRALVERIFREYRGRFQRISFNIVKSEETAEDVVSTAFVKIMDNIEKISDLPCP